MVEVQPRPGLSVGRAPEGQGSLLHRWHRRPWPHLGSHLRLPRSIVGTLVRLDDDPVLLCDCAEGAPHTCG
jgi:hypothetical protein